MALIPIPTRKSAPIGDAYGGWKPEGYLMAPELEPYYQRDSAADFERELSARALADRVVHVSYRRHTARGNVDTGVDLLPGVNPEHRQFWIHHQSVQDAAQRLEAARSDEQWAEYNKANYLCSVCGNVEPAMSTAGAAIHRQLPGGLGAVQACGACWPVVQKCAIDTVAGMPTKDGARTRGEAAAAIVQALLGNPSTALARR